MRRRSALAAICALVVVGGSLASSSLAQTPLASAGLTHITGSTEARLCNQNILYPSGDPNHAAEAPCLNAQGQIPYDGWRVDMPPESASWQFDDKRHVEFPIPGFASAILDAEAHNTFAASIGASGGFVSETIHVDMTASARAAADASVNQGWTVEFDTNAPSIKVIGKAAKTLHTVPADINGRAFSEGQFAVVVNCSIANGQIVKGLPNTDWNVDIEVPLDAELKLDGSLRHCQLQVVAQATALVQTNNIDGPDPARSGFSHVTADVTITAETGKCSVVGAVVAGPALTADMSRTVPGIPVEVYAEGKPKNISAVTDTNGKFCLRGLDPGVYELRATLIDGAHNPPLFKTLHDESNELVTTSLDIGVEDFEGDEVAIGFADNNRDWLWDLAETHRLSARFLNWALASLKLDGKIAPFTVRSFVTRADSLGNAPPTGAHYIVSTSTVRLAPKYSVSSEHDDWDDHCPEACEWHEIGHHIAYQLGIAAGDPAGACDHAVNHDGWLNDSTCDSLQEAFASFVALAASTELEADRGPGYATTEFAGFGDMEDNSWRPWSTDWSGSLQREELALVGLLWDLTDNSKLDVEPVNIVDSGVAGAPPFPWLAEDDVFMPVRDLVDLMDQANVATVADLYSAVDKSPFVATSFKRKANDINADGRDDLSQLDDVFLMHGFNPVDDINQPEYVLPDPIGPTDRIDISGAQEFRRDVPQAAGSAIEFLNPGSAPLTFGLTVTYANGPTSHEIVVEPQSSKLVHLELPPYWQGRVEPGADLPACGDQGQRAITVSINAEGLESRTISNCEYQQAAKAATGDSAISFGGTLPSPTDNDVAPQPTATPAAPQEAGAAAALPTPLWIAAAGLFLIALFLGAFWVGRRGARGRP